MGKACELGRFVRDSKLHNVSASELLQNSCTFNRTITGPNDRMICSTLTLPRVPIFDKEWSHTNVCVWEVVSAHLLLEDALVDRPQEVGGQAFLVTGKSRAPWTMRENRNAVKVSTGVANLSLRLSLYEIVSLTPRPVLLIKRTHI